MHLVIGDSGGPAFCGPVGDVSAGRAGSYVMRGAAGNGSLVVKLSQKKGGTLVLRGRGLDLTALDDPTMSFGLRIGALRFVASGAFRSRGGRWVYP
jgi:hypothetical protein